MKNFMVLAVSEVGEAPCWYYLVTFLLSNKSKVNRL